MSGYTGYRQFLSEDSDGVMVCKSCWLEFGYPEDLPKPENTDQTHCDSCGEWLGDPTYDPPLEGD